MVCLSDCLPRLAATRSRRAGTECGSRVACRDALRPFSLRVAANPPFPMPEQPESKRRPLTGDSRPARRGPPRMPAALQNKLFYFSKCVGIRMNWVFRATELGYARWRLLTRNSVAGVGARAHRRQADWIKAVDRRGGLAARCAAGRALGHRSGGIRPADAAAHARLAQCTKR